MIPDLAIVDQLHSFQPEVEVRFVSYGMGAATLRESGLDVIDLDLPSANPPLETLVRATRIIGNVGPDFVAAHEEFVVMPAAKIFDLPTLFITDFFGPEVRFSMQALQYADEVVFTGEPGVFEEPIFVRGRVNCVGPIFRDFKMGKEYRATAREEIGLDPEALVVSVMPGSWSDEQAPIFDLVASTFQLIERAPKSLIWVAGDEYDKLRARAEQFPFLTVIRHEWQIGRLMVASDLAITKANRVTARELAALGIPSISLSHGVNPPDDVVVERISSNVALDAKTTSPEDLARTIGEVLDRERTKPLEPLDPSKRGDGRRAAAQRISDFIDRVQAAREPAPAQS